MNIDLTNFRPCPRCTRMFTDQPLCMWCAEAVRVREEKDLLEERQQGLEAKAIEVDRLRDELVNLQTRLDFLTEAARAVIVRWDSIDWKNTEHTGVVIDRLRKALHATTEPADSEVKP
jgi:hypothetical protein